MNLSLLLGLCTVLGGVNCLDDTELAQIQGMKDLLANMTGIYSTCNMVLFAEMIDYSTAEANCKNFTLGSSAGLAGNLVTVNDDDKNEQIKLLLEMAYPDSYKKWADEQWVWAGLRKVHNNDEALDSSQYAEYNPEDWAWADGSTVTGFEKWMKGMPDQKPSKMNGVKYLQNQMRINHGGKWDDTFAYKTHPYACDYQGKYILSATRKSWSDAKTACENAGLILAKVRNEAEVEEMVGAALFYLGVVDESLREFAGTNWIWLGANDATEEGLWQWNDGTLLGDWFDTMPWRPPNPDNSRRLNKGKSQQNVLAISKWGLFDDSFDSPKRLRPFACQCPGT